MKPRIIRVGIFLLLWVAYLGADFISFASKKIAAKNYSNLIVSASKQAEFKAASENFTKVLLGTSENAGSVPALMKEVNRIEARKAAFLYASLSVWFYLCAGLIYFFFNRVEKILNKHAKQAITSP